MSTMTLDSGEVLGLARRVHRLVTLDGPLATAVEHRQLWEAMTHDRRTTAALLVVLVTKLLMAGAAADDALPEAVSNLIHERPLVPGADERARAPTGALGARLDPRKAVVLRQLLIHTIFLIAIHYPFNSNEPLLGVALRRWTQDISDNPADHDALYETDIIALVYGANNVDADKMLHEFVVRCVKVSTAALRAEAADNYNSPSNTPSIRLLSEALIFPFLVSCVRLGERASTIVRSTVAELIGRMDSLPESHFVACMSMLNEFFATSAADNAELLEHVREHVRPYYIWPQPHSQTVSQFIKRCEHHKKALGLARCWHFLEHRPHLLQRSDHNTHVIVNPASLQGLATRELLREHASTIVLPEDEHKLRCKFINLCFKNLIPDDTAPMHSMVGVDPVVVQPLFDRVLEVMRTAVDTGHVSQRQMTVLKTVKKECDEVIVAQGIKREPIAAGDLSDYASLGSLAAQIWDLDEGSFAIERAVNAPSDMALPDVGSFATLSKIFAPYMDTKAATAMHKRGTVTVKIVIVGGDSTLHNVLCGYVALRHLLPDVFTHVRPRFYVVPAGNRTRFGSLLGVLDPWYFRQVTLQLRAALTTVPAIARLPPRKGSVRELIAEGSTMMTSELRDLLRAKEAVRNDFCVLPSKSDVPRHRQSILGNSPAMICRGLVEHYVRAAARTLEAHVYVAEVHMLVNNVAQRRMVPFLQGIELGANAFNVVQLASELEAGTPKSHVRRNSLAPPTRGAKFTPPELTIKMTEINVAGITVQTPAIAAKPYFLVQVSNLPRTAEQAAVVNPSSNCLELYLLDTDAGRRVARGKAQGGVDEGQIHYISSVEIEEPARRPFELLIDDQPVAQVVKLRVSMLKDPVKPTLPDGQENPLVLPFAHFADQCAE